MTHMTHINFDLIWLRLVGRLTRSTGLGQKAVEEQVWALSFGFGVYSVIQN